MLHFVPLYELFLQIFTLKLYHPIMLTTSLTLLVYPFHFDSFLVILECL